MDKKQQLHQLKLRAMMAMGLFVGTSLSGMAQSDTYDGKVIAPNTSVVDKSGLLMTLDNRDLSASERIKAFRSALKKGILTPKYNQGTSDVKYVDKEGFAHATLSHQSLKLHSRTQEFFHAGYHTGGMPVSFKSPTEIIVTDVYDEPKTEKSDLQSVLKAYEKYAEKSATIAESAEGKIEQTYDSQGNLKTEDLNIDYKVADAATNQINHYQEKGGYDSSGYWFHDINVKAMDKTLEKTVEEREIRITPSYLSDIKKTYYPSGRIKSYQDMSNGYEHKITYDDTPTGKTTSVSKKGQTTEFSYNEKEQLTGVTYIKNGESVSIEVLSKPKPMHAHAVEEYAVLSYEQAKVTSAQDLDKAVINAIAKRGQIARCSMFAKEVRAIWDAQKTNFATNTNGQKANDVSVRQ